MRTEWLPTFLALSCRIRQVLDNLLSNAIKFSADGGTIAVRLQMHEGGSLAQFTASDNGVGIDSVRIPELLKLAKLYGGRIEACSDGLGQGARFGVWLPTLGSQQ